MDHWTGRTTAQKCQSLIRLQYHASELLGLHITYLAFDCKACILDVLWCQPIKLIQVVSTSEFHEY